MSDAIATIVLAPFAGFVIGVLIWLLRFLMIQLPHGGNWKGGDIL
jgi:Na+-transporting NADH:ubiquinone oxidoreductase subunit NqrD